MNKYMLDGFKRVVESIQFTVADEYGKFLIIFVVILFAMFIDVVTGLRQAHTNNTILSAKLSDGILKKGQILLIILFIMFVGICLPPVIGIPLIFLTCLWEIYNEVVSITENLFKQGVEINFLNPILETLKKEIQKREENETNGGE